MRESTEYRVPGIRYLSPSLPFRRSVVIDLGIRTVGSHVLQHNTTYLLLSSFLRNSSQPSNQHPDTIASTQHSAPSTKLPHLSPTITKNGAPLPKRDLRDPVRVPAPPNVHPPNELVLDIPHHNRLVSRIRCVGIRAYGVGGVGCYEEGDAGCGCKTRASQSCKRET